MESKRDVANLISNMRLFTEGTKAALELASNKSVGDSRRAVLQAQVAMTRKFLWYFLKNCKNPDERECYLSVFMTKAPWFCGHPKEHLMTVLSVKPVSALSSGELQEQALIFATTEKILQETRPAK